MDIFEAAKTGNVEEVKKRIQDGTDVNSREECGATALMRAAGYGHPDVVKALIDTGAS